MSLLCAGVLAVGEVWAGAGVPDEVMESLVRMKVMRPHVHGNRLYELSRHYELVLAGKESMRDYPYLAKLMSKTRFLGPRHAVDKTKLPEEVVQAFVEAGVDVNACEESERRENPLLIAARNYGATVCRLLLEAGANPNVQDAYGNTPLHNVCAYSDDAETARMLLAAGANPNVLNGLGQTPMELAMKNMRPGIAHALLDYGVRREDMKAHALDVAVFLGDAEGCRSEMAKVRQKTEAYTQALHLAAKLGHVEICRMLLEAGADANSMQELQNKTPSVTIKTVSTPLSKAAAGGHAEVCRLLLAAGADPNAAPALINAATAGHAEICRLLLEAGAKMGSAEGWHSPLFAAAYRGHIETCRVLIDALGKLGEKERLKMLNGALSPAIQEGKAEALRLLLEAGAQIETCGTGILCTAARSGSEEVCRMILELRGKSALKTRSIGRTPLHDCILFSGDLAICRFLVSAGADVNAREEYGGNTALIMAVSSYRSDIARLLLAAGADPNIANTDGHTPLKHAILSGDERMCRLLLESGAKFSDTTPLHMHAAFGHAEECNNMLRAGADADAKDAEGNTPLLYAAYHGQLATAELLLSAGADPNAGNELPLILAARNSDVPMCLLLLSAGADRKLSRRNECAEEFVRNRRRKEISELLAKYPKRLTPDAALDKVARERGLNKENYTISYSAPYYVIEVKLPPESLGGGEKFKVNTCTGEIVAADFTE